MSDEIGSLFPDQPIPDGPDVAEVPDLPEPAPVWEPYYGAVEPVLITIEAEHIFKKRPVPDGKKRRPPGCAICGKGKLRDEHLGAPPSMNDGGSGMDRMAYQSLKSAWMNRITRALEESGLQRGLKRVMVEGRIGFDTRTGRDEGNVRWMIEKALGDALKEGGWLEDDTFYPVRRYSFGVLEGIHDKGRSYTQLMILPEAHEVEE